MHRLQLVFEFYILYGAAKLNSESRNVKLFYLNFLWQEKHFETVTCYVFDSCLLCLLYYF